jgi:cyanate permease
MKSFAETLGLHMGILALVMGFSSPLIGMLYDHTGSYNLALALMVGGDLCAGLLMLTLGPYRYTTQFTAMPVKDDPQNTRSAHLDAAS